MKLFSTFMLIFCFSTLIAKNNKSIDLKIAQYDYFDFVDKYGMDDTSIVLIDLFLKKRIEQGLGEMSFLPITSAVTLAVPPIGIVLTTISLPFAMHGGVIYFKYSKHRLAKILTRYNNGEGLSKMLTKKVIKHYELMKLENLSEIKTNPY